MDIGTFDLHGLTLCVSEVVLSVLLCIHIVDIETFYLHALILCVSEDLLSDLLCVHIVGIETFDLHGLILHDVFQKKLIIAELLIIFYLKAL